MDQNTAIVTGNQDSGEDREKVILFYNTLSLFKLHYIFLGTFSFWGRLLTLSLENKTLMMYEKDSWRRPGIGPTIRWQCSWSKKIMCWCPQAMVSAYYRRIVRSFATFVIKIYMTILINNYAASDKSSANTDKNTSRLYLSVLNCFINYYLFVFI